MQTLLRLRSIELNGRDVPSERNASLTANRRWNYVVVLVIVCLSCTGIWRYWHDWELPRRQAIRLNTQIQEKFDKNGVSGYANVLFYFKRVEFHGEITAEDIRLVAPLLNNQDDWLLCVDVTDTRVEPVEAEVLRKELNELMVVDNSE